MIAVGFFQVYAVTTKAIYRIYTWGANPQTLRLQAHSLKKKRQQSELKRTIRVDVIHRIL